jgi:hypothetical protein
MAMLVAMHRSRWTPIAVVTLATAIRVILWLYPSRNAQPWIHALFARGCASIQSVDRFRVANRW